MQKRKHRKYDDECYLGFGEQPRPLELQIGLYLSYRSSEALLRETRYVRNQIDAEFGLPLPPICIRDNLCIAHSGYKILLHGVEVAGYDKLWLGHVLCLNTGSVTEELVGEKIMEPVFETHGIAVQEDRAEEAKSLGYLVVEPTAVIRTHLIEIIKKNITKFLDQSMVNTLINKVRDKNPDVVDDVFFMNNFSTAKLKTILNWLLEEGICIRNMNTILETIAEYLEETKNLIELMEKVREKLAYQFLPKLAGNNKVFHVIRVSQGLAEALAERIYYPQSKNELPYYALSPVENKAFDNSIRQKARCMKEKGYEPVFLIISSLRTALSNSLRPRIGNWPCISDKELYSVSNDYTIVVEEELEVDEIKVNGSGSCCN